ncbi:hypothetical protein SteCoe_30592 [Stentor coeruleus]|uniref:Lipid-binding serum glycoprotein C-terminal domain-containing protein n=1 Tax=Stentor coeruleus TaxID=5963 RepID=A0A1R2B387_9CILI|nr:hypothetical protein SteCoe_30592 [Stentor coeruleus]
MKILLFGILSCLFLSANANPALKLGIAKEALMEVFTLIEGHSLSFALPNQTVEPISKTTLYLYNMILTIKLKKDYILIENPCNITINMSDTDVGMTFNYTEKGIISSKGVGTVTIPDNYIFLQSTFSIVQGSLQISIWNANAFFHNSIVVTPLGSAINTELENFINNYLPTAEVLISVEIENLQDPINAVLLSITKYFPIPPWGMMVNLTLEDDYLLEADLLTLPIKGEFLRYPYRTSVMPFDIPRMPEFVQGLPLQMLISEYFIQLVTPLLWQTTTFNVTELPQALPIQLTTDGLAFLLPGLRQKYGYGKNVIVGVSPSANFTPSLEINITTQVNLNVSLELKVYVVVNSTYTVEAIDFHNLLAISLMFNVYNYTANFDVKTIALDGFQVNNIGGIPYNQKQFFKMVGLVMKTLLPILNAMGAVGIPIPQPTIPFIYFPNNEISVANNSLLLGLEIAIG